MELRIRPAMKELIQRAMAVSGKTAGELAVDAAKRVLDEHEWMMLSRRDSKALLAALLEPPPPSPRLVAAIRRHDKLVAEGRIVSK